MKMNSCGGVSRSRCGGGHVGNLEGSSGPWKVVQALREQGGMSTPIRATLWITWWRSPPLRAGRRGEPGYRILGTTLRRLPLGNTSCRIHSGGRRRNVRRSRRTRRSCARPVLCGAEVPCAEVSNRGWRFDGGAGNCVAGELAYSTLRAPTACLCRTPGSRPDHHGNPHAWACWWTASWLILGRAVLGRELGAIARPLDDQLVGGVRQAVQGAIAQQGIVKEGQPLVDAAV